MLSWVARRAAGEGRANRGDRASVGRTGRGAAWDRSGPPSRRGCSAIGLAALTCASRNPDALHPQGRSQPPRHGVLRSYGRDSRREGLGSTLERGGHFPDSRTWLPRLLSTNQRSLLPASGCVPPAGTRGAVSLAPEQHPVPVAAAGQGVKMSPRLWNRSFRRRSDKACRLSLRCRAGRSGPFPLFSLC